MKLKTLLFTALTGLTVSATASSIEVKDVFTNEADCVCRSQMDEDDCRLLCEAKEAAKLNNERSPEKFTNEIKLLAKSLAAPKSNTRLLAKSYSDVSPMVAREIEDIFADVLEPLFFGDLNGFKAAVDNLFDINLTYDGANLLMMVIFFEDGLEAAKYLIHKGIDINYEFDGVTVLDVAYMLGLDDIARLLERHGATTGSWMDF